MFKKIFTSLMLFAMALSLSGCSFEFSVSPNETAYLYKTDIYESTRYNPGSDYEFVLPFETKRQMLSIDYGTTTVPFTIDYTLTDKENKTRVQSNAIITFRLLRNPDDTKKLEFKDDKYAQFYTENIKPTSNGQGFYRIEPEIVFKRLMNETLDKVFRKEFTDLERYPDFDSIEANIDVIRDRIKEQLVISSKDAKIEIVGLSISSPLVPDPIQTSRNKMLELQQDALNNTKELEIKAQMAAGRMAVDVRESINDVVLDRIAGQVDKGYLLIKTFNRAIDEKAPLNLTITPDFMRYLENESSDKNNTSNNEMFDKLNKMSDAELQEYFSRSNSK